MSQQEITLNQSTEHITSQTQTLGQWLVGVRQAQGLSAQDVASRTNRNLRQIMALEADDYSAVNAPVLLRAIVRHYAKAVGVNEDEAVTHLPVAYQQASVPKPQRDAELNKVFTHSGTPLKKPWISRTALVLLTLAVFGLLAYWIFGARFTAKTDGAQKISEPNQVQVIAPVAPPVVAAPVETVVVAPIGDDLILKFKANSWVEIKDADGKVLLSGEQLENTEQSVMGKLPLKVKVGNATNVEASWKGVTYDLTPFIKGGVARLSLE